MRKFLLLFLGLSLLLGTASSAIARQSNLASADLYPADTSSFPKISAFLDVFNSNGIFASGLIPEAVTVIEDGQPLPIDSLSEIAVPLQLVIAVNQGPPLDTRDSATNTSRFQRLAQVLAQWAQSRPPEIPDDYSLVSQAGPVINHANATDFIVGLTTFQPDFRAATPNLQSLAVAMDTVSAQTSRLGVKRAILFITPHTDDPNVTSILEQYAQRAIENNIHIFIWFVDLDSTFATTSAAAFNNLAILTGGSMFKYSGTERFPDPESYFAPLRRVYSISYTSHVNTSETHTLGVRVILPVGSLNSAEQNFQVDVQPPNPFPVTTSLQITRRAPEDDPYNTEILLPVAQEIEIIIEFPDGHPRPLTRTSLYVDGLIMDENTVEPFNLFTWDLSAYKNSGEHQIIVEAVDSLGLSKLSMGVPLVVTVIQPPRGIAGILGKYRTQLTFGAILLAGMVLFLILISGRFRLPSIRAAQDAHRVDADPLTQSINTVTGVSVLAPLTAAPAGKTRKPRGPSKKATAESKSKMEAAASFIRINMDGMPAAVAPLLLIEKEITFGTDPVQCTQIMDEPSISSLHARLRQTEDGGYLLQDHGSVAGTWVNYEPIPREGYRLAHGDMVNFGQLSYRFTLKMAPMISKPTITLQNPEE